MFPDQLVVHSPLSDLDQARISEVSLYGSAYKRTCVAKASVIDHGKVHPHA